LSLSFYFIIIYMGGVSWEQILKLYIDHGRMHEEQNVLCFSEE
jgi:hypothetical protein